ncbi:hypothetical protein Tco_1164113 [Tanacetum coccineum]
MENVDSANIHLQRSYYTKPAFRPKDLKQDVKTFGVQNMTTAGTRAVVNTGKGKMDTNLKKSRWVWRPKGNYLDHVSKDCGSFMLKKVEAIQRSCYRIMQWWIVVNVDAGTQDSYVAGSSGKDTGPTQENILFPLQPHRTRIPVEDIPPAAHEKPSESSPKDNDVQDTEDATDKEEQHQMKESEQDLQDELEKMVTQELADKAMDDISRQAFEEEKRRIASQKKAAQATSTNILSTDRQSVSTDRPSVSTDRPSVSTDRPFVSTDRPSVSTDRPFVRKIPIDASTLPNADLPIDPNMSDLEDASDTLPTDGLFNGAYNDDEDVGTVADFNSMDNTIAVSPIPTLRIHKDHLKGQILGDAY